uniref:Tripartite motif-containing protein 3 n=2 Tax=Schistocephalus solidus TaxID=70667 RepID=A0A0X3PQI0_SCHSO
MSSPESSFFECPICLSTFQAPVMLACQHSFCWKCLQKYMKSDGRMCPVCRERIKGDSDITRNLLLEQLLSEKNKVNYIFLPSYHPFIHVPVTGQICRLPNIWINRYRLYIYFAAKIDVPPI